MAKLEMTLQGSFDRIAEDITHCIRGGSVTASLEDSSDFRTKDGRCAVYVFERYSFWGGNRLSLTITLYQDYGDPRIYASAITAGGSQVQHAGRRDLFRGSQGCTEPPPLRRRELKRYIV